MKTKRCIILLVVIALFAGASLNSCDNKSQHYDYAPDSGVENDSTFTDINKAVIDTLSSIKSKLETVSEDSKQAVKEVGNVKVSITQLQRKELWQWGAILSLGLIVITLIVTCLKLHNKIDKKNKEIGDLLQKNNKAPTNLVNTGQLSQDYRRLDGRIQELERTISILRKPQQPQGGSERLERTPAIQKGYFETPVGNNYSSGSYFNKLSNVNESESRFYVEVKGDHASFKPITEPPYVKNAISIDAMSCAIEFNGCNKREDPSIMIVNKPGLAILERGKWVIKEKAIVTLKK